MRRIMFVCHGNICRSPMAEYIFKHLVDKVQLTGEYFASSSATSTEEIGFDGIGNEVYPPAKAELLRHGIDCEGKRAVQLKKEDYEKYDYFMCMDKANLQNARRILGGDPDCKIEMLNEREVSDPWYSGDFETAYNEIYEGCMDLIKRLIIEECIS